MGLDITAYKRVERVDHDDPDAVDTFTVANSRDFAGREAPLVDGAVYVGSGTFGFRAGSYSGYNDWRELLAKMAGYPAVGDDRRHQHSEGAWQATGGPFWELIHFTDCDGVIGAAVAAKLAADFRDWDARAMAFAVAVKDHWFYDRYADWRRAMETAANGGAVEFH